MVLEEKQALQLQYEELSALYESTKRELEISGNVSDLVPLHYVFDMWRNCGKIVLQMCNLICAWTNLLYK